MDLLGVTVESIGNVRMSYINNIDLPETCETIEYEIMMSFFQKDKPQ